MKIIMDVWGGEQSQDLVARFVRDLDTCLELAAIELRAGFLINLRMEPGAWQDFAEFDERKISHD